MDKLKFGIVSLGCDKNRIDSETIMGKMNREYEIVNDPRDAEIIIVNTCGFIESSKQESINTILEMSEYKNKYKCKVLVVTGCLSQRYKEDLLELMPEIDVLLGVNNYDKLIDSVNKYVEEKEKSCFCNYSDENINGGERVLTTGNHTAYIRISEGCNNFCAYCIIPKIRGKYRSRKLEELINETTLLAGNGVKEIILVAQDTTRYGVDLYGEKKLHMLVNELSKVNGIKWIRLLYCYPEEIYDDLIEEIANNEKVCKYMDMPIQHISNSVLRRMKRRGKKEDIIDNIKQMRSKIKGLALRTSIIVGFPGESNEEFSELKEFIKEIKFDKLGVFKYSQEEGTIAAEMEDQLDEEVKEKREEEIMLLQQSISKEINENKIGNIYDVIVEGIKNDLYYGRNYEMSPQIDGEIFFKCDTMLDIGKIVPIKITQALEYDLIGVVCYESC